MYTYLHIYKDKYLHMCKDLWLKSLVPPTGTHKIDGLSSASATEQLVI